MVEKEIHSSPEEGEEQLYQEVKKAAEEERQAMDAMFKAMDESSPRDQETSGRILRDYVPGLEAAMKNHKEALDKWLTAIKPPELPEKA
jgi:hypothetical protein